MTRVDTEIQHHLGGWQGFMCGPYSAHSPFAQFRQFAVLAVAWTIADLAGRSMRHCHVGECGRPGRIRGVTTATPSYKGHRYPVEIINHCVWLYFRFPLSFREVEELMLVRGVAVSYETIRRWCARFGQAYANQLRRGARAPATSGTSMRCSSGSTAGCGTCGARSTSTATCSTFSSSHAETRWRPSDSSVRCVPNVEGGSM